MLKVITILFIAFLLYLLYYFVLKGKPRKLSINATDRLFLSKQVAFYDALDSEQKTNFEERMMEFLRFITFEGIGTDVTRQDQLLVAASAIIPIFGFPYWRYKTLTNVILYPNRFNKEYEIEGNADRNILGMVGDGAMNGQMILSKTALYQGFQNHHDSENTAIHEFVHLIDKSDGQIDGIPENLLKHQYTIPWIHLMKAEIEKIQEGDSNINPYASTNPAEFFAVTAEYFFENPKGLQQQHPELYQKLSIIFGQNPLEKIKN